MSEQGEYAQKWVDGYGRVRWQPVFGEMQLAPWGWVLRYPLYQYGDCGDPKFLKLYRSHRRAARIGRKAAFRRMRKGGCDE